jgi:integrase/recombinase XerC
MSTELVPITRAQTQIDVTRPIDVVDAFLSGRKGTTLRAYDGDLKHFARALGQADAKAAVAFLLAQPPGHANAIALSYRNKMMERNLSGATIGRRLSALRSVVKLARTLGQVTWTLDVEAPKVEPYRDTRGPGDEGWHLMLSYAIGQARGGTAKAIRDLALLRVVHDLALRRAEVAALDLADVDVAGKALAIIGKGRTDKERLSLPNSTLFALLDWIKVRGDWPGPLFYRLDRASASAEGPATHLTGRAVHHLVKALGRRAGVARPVWPHALRHQAITSALDLSGGNIRDVQKYSRHADPRTLMRYDDARRDVAGDIARRVAGD